MGKLILLLCFALLAVTLTIACGPPGNMCSTDDQCCHLYKCNRFIGRCIAEGNFPQESVPVEG
ncbi:uncharacterized protein LOC126856457 [Cataglyphis hispanica]|uniref:uncharacterized protein LOC126856457 n=1 Tax=Cataglyphis hispanica TaxID=1086592 RepID=UPI00218026CA|nr:uncharacterized protein LOC126856457 [Cataglyphis hispanica]